MGVEVENASGDTQTTVATPSTVSISAPKMSMFSRKSGFVIPKNKLSGSLVPVFRGTKKGDGDPVNEDAPTQAQRKTKWGPDLTLDNTVRKGRALAYQTRINQISQQLTLKTLAVEDNHDPLSTSDFHEGKSSGYQLNTEKLEQLELERREVIGEILKLNPSYKPPANYKPLLKEAKVPIPIKEYPGYNFIGLVYGPASDTQKRLEKETGAKVRVYGTKTDTGGEVEVTPDGKEALNAYEDMYVHVSADTFEKVDAAVALIELLVTPVSVNSVSTSSASIAVSDDNVDARASQSTPNSSTASPLINQAMSQPYAGSLQPLQGPIQQYPQAWFPVGPTQTTTYPQSGLVNPAISSTPLLSNPVQVSSFPFNPANMTMLSGPQPAIATSFSSILQNPSYAHSRSQYPNPLQPPNMHNALLPSQAGRPPFISTLPQPAPLPASQGLTNFNSMTPPVNSMASQNPGFSGSRPVNFHNQINSPVSGPFLSPGIAASQQNRGGFPPFPLQAPQSSPSAAQPSSVGPLQSAVPQVAMHTPGSNSLSAGLPRPQQPSSGDFTYQPHRPPFAVSQAAVQSSQPHPNLRPPFQNAVAPLAPQPPSMRPLIQNSSSSFHGFPSPQVSHQLNQPRGQVPMNFTGSPTAPPGPPRHPAFPGPNGAASPSGPHIQPRNFIPSRPMNNFTGPFPPRPGTQMQNQQNHTFGASRPPMFPGTQYFGNHPGKPFPRSFGGQQIYDPFSPSSESFNPQMMGGNTAKLRDESDPEYEDLMASVGVK